MKVGAISRLYAVTVALNCVTSSTYQRRVAVDDKASIYFHFRVFSKSGTNKSMEQRHMASLTHP